jgi:hypothetical protein
MTVEAIIVPTRFTRECRARELRAANEDYGTLATAACERCQILRQSGTKFGLSQDLPLSAAIAALIFLLAGFSHAQDTQFAFDARGNLAVQTAEISVPPQIVSQPQNQVVKPGALASFSVVASDTRGLTSQWLFNGTNLAGATGDALLLANVNAANEGLYSVVLANPSGSITSAPAALLLDGDGDGLPDSWEQTYFGGLNQKPTGDFDGDGVSNLDEYLDGTNPADSASLLFRLTVISDGGNVAVNPGRFTFTNGETVTLTAAAISPNTFHGWRGATNTTENPISLTMDGNKTVYAYLGSYQITWTNNASGDWNDASNWSPDFVPGNNDDVIISRNVTVTLNSNTECGGLTLSTTPTLTGSGTLVLHRNSAWSGGTMNGSGRTVVAPGATLDINGAGTKTLSGGRILENGGTTSWNAGIVQAATATVITNRVGGLFLVPSAAGMTPGAGGGRFDNAGTFRKMAAGTTTINGLVSFNNYGTVELLSGTLSLAGGGLNDGTMDLAAGTTLGLAAGTFNSSGGSSITGAGQFMVSGATANLAGLVAVTGTNRFDLGTANLTGNYICTNNTLVVSGGTANFSGTGMVTPAVVSMDSGTLSGSQNVTVLQQMNWSGGTMSGAGRTVIPPSVTLTINGGTVTLSGGRILENGGTTLWNAGNIQAATATVITNRASALFQVQSAAGITPGAGGGRFDNAGTFLKTSAGTTTINNLVSFNNYGAVELQSGTLSLMGGGLNQGSMDVAAGTTLGLTGGTFTSSAASSITGAGNFLVSNGATPTLAGLVNVSGTNTFSGSTANLTGNYICTNNTLVVSGGTVNLNGTGLVSPVFLTLGGGGTMNGSQDVTVGGVMNWTGGTLAGSGRTIILPSAMLNESGGPALSAHTLENGGTAIWTGSLNIGSAVITNRAGALFELRSATILNSSSLPGSRFDNAGTFRKSVNTGTATILTGMAFNNYNTVEIQTGILTANGGYVSTANSLLKCALGGTTVGTGYGRLQVGGTVTLNGGLSVDLLPGFTPATNDTFTVLTAGTRNGTFANFSYPSNRVTMTLSNAPTSVILRTTDIFSIPHPVLLTPELAGPDVKLTWTATSNVAYRLEFNSKVDSSNWTAIAGDVTTLSNTASKLDALTPSNRLYRVRVLQ